MSRTVTQQSFLLETLRFKFHLIFMCHKRKNSFDFSTIGNKLLSAREL